MSERLFEHTRDIALNERSAKQKQGTALDELYSIRCWVRARRDQFGSGTFEYTAYDEWYQSQQGMHLIDPGFDNQD